MSYHKINVTISEGQKKSIREAYADGDGLTIQFSYNDLVTNGADIIGVTKTQNKRIVKAIEDHKGVRINMSPAQVKANLKIKGGFLGALLGLATRFLPTIAKAVLPGLAVGALSGAASAGVERAIKGKGLYLKKGGCMCRVDTTSGGGLYLSPIVAPRKTLGDGVYLERGSGYEQVGQGLLLGKNSPFKNIPILGMIL